MTKFFLNERFGDPALIARAEQKTATAALREARQTVTRPIAAPKAKSLTARVITIANIASETFSALMGLALFSEVMLVQLQHQQAKAPRLTPAAVRLDKNAAHYPQPPSKPKRTSALVPQQRNNG